MREWVSVPPVWLVATLAHEQAYLEQWQQRRLAEERHEGEYLEMLERGAEEDQCEAEEEARLARTGPDQPPAVQAPADDVARAWSTALPWAGPAPTLINLIGPDDDDKDA